MGKNVCSIKKLAIATLFIQINVRADRYRSIFETFKKVPSLGSMLF
jgi:hypothetical protein